MQTLGPKQQGRQRRWLLPLLAATLAALLMLGGDDAAYWLRYERDALAQGQLWRLFSAHWVHLGWSHLLMNMFGLLLVWALVGEALSLLGWLLLLLFCSLFTTAAMWLLYPELQWYVGFSGVLHGMLFGGAMMLFGGGDKGATLLAGIVLLKLLWEQLLGPLPGSESAAGGAVIVEAHLYGALAGGLFAAVAYRFKVES
ncbi:MAG TPA: rhombosortase [Gammaproteobacteria bacterium]